MAMAPTVWLNPPPCSGRLRDFSRPSSHLFRAGLLSSSILRRKLDDRMRQRRQSYTSDPREGTTTVAAFRSFLLVRIEETSWQPRARDLPMILLLLRSRSLIGPGLNTFCFASIHSNGGTRHPFRCGRHHECEQVGDLFRTAVATDLHFFGKLFHGLFNAHIVRRGPLLHEGASPSRHHRTRYDAVDLHAILNTLFGERFGQRDNSGINRSDGGEGRLRIQSGAA